MKNPFAPVCLKESLREGVRALRSRTQRDLSPERAARSVAIGLFVGCSPFYGFHFFICAGLAYLFRLDLLVTYIATNISIAPVIPLLVFVEVQIGNRLLEGRWLSVAFDDFSLEQAKRMGGSLFLGALMVGSVLAIVGGLFTWFATRFLKRRREGDVDSALSRAVHEVKVLYKSVKPAHRHYVRLKLLTDPLVRELYLLVRAEGSLGFIVDAACGRGQFSLLLAKLGATAGVFGFDHDLPKVCAAQEAAQGFDEQRVEYVLGDLRSIEVPRADTILLLDVLHYLPIEEQDLLIERLSQRLTPGGRIIVREVNHKGGMGASLAKLLECLAKVLRLNRGAHLEYRAPGSLEKRLEEQGFRVTRYAPRGMLSNVLLVAESET